MFRSDYVNPSRLYWNSLISRLACFSVGKVKSTIVISWFVKHASTFIWSMQLSAVILSVFVWVSIVWWSLGFSPWHCLSHLYMLRPVCIRQRVLLCSIVVGCPLLPSVGIVSVFCRDGGGGSLASWDCLRLWVRTLSCSSRTRTRVSRLLCTCRATNVTTRHFQLGVILGVSGGGVSSLWITKVRFNSSNFSPLTDSHRLLQSRGRRCVGLLCLLYVLCSVPCSLFGVTVRLWMPCVQWEVVVS